MKMNARRILPIALTTVLVAMVLLLQGCATRASDSTDASGNQQAQTPAEEAPTQVEETPLFTPTYTPNGNEIAVITTDKGVIRIDLHPEHAPNHVASFVELAQKGFYDGTKFHRVEPGFVIQGGDPLSRTDDPRVGTGGPGYRVAAEFNELQHLDGTLSMARSQDVDSAGSQFFICLGPQSFLDGQYTVFGQVIEGMEVVRAITKGDVMRSVVIENATE